MPNPQRDKGCMEADLVLGSHFEQMKPDFLKGAIKTLRGMGDDYSLGIADCAEKYLMKKLGASA